MRKLLKRVICMICIACLLVPSTPALVGNGEEIVAAPTVSPGPCEFDEYIDVTLSCATPGATILYYLDFPNHGLEYPAVMLEYTEPLHLTYTTVLHAYAEKDGVMSEGITVTYTNRNEVPITVEDPVITPGSTTFEDEIEVTITCPTEGADIHYFLKSLVTGETIAFFEYYSGPIRITESCELSAYSSLYDAINSGSATAIYTKVVKPKVEVESIVSGSESDTINLKLTSPDEIKGTILVAECLETGGLCALTPYPAETVLPVQVKKNTAVKVFWWESASTMIPVATPIDARTLSAS